MPRMGEARWNEDFRENNPKNLAVLMLFFSFFFFLFPLSSWKLFLFPFAINLEEIMDRNAKKKEEEKKKKRFDRVKLELNCGESNGIYNDIYVYIFWFYYRWIKHLFIFIVHE